VSWGSLKLTVRTKAMTKTFSMDDILALRPRKEFPVTLLSAFFRQAELHALRSTLNHDTSTCRGTTSIGTQVYKGVWLRTVLKLMGIDKPQANNWVIARGEDGYSASIPLGYCCNPASEILLAYVANGEPLLPDHGYPFRLIVPGKVASYSVKWLNELVVTGRPDMSPSPCLLPPKFSASELNSMNTWLNYRMTEASLQCVMTIPQHNHQITLPHNLTSTLELGGFAYAGGGRHITRIEVSFDDGATWELVKNMDAKERTTSRDRRWCWVWWKHEVQVEDIVSKSTIWCRAWDSTNSSQPEMPTWNLMGVGANHIYKLHLVPTRLGGHYTLRVQHPISDDEGWLKSPANLPLAAGFGPLLNQDEGVYTQASVSSTIDSPELGEMKSLQYSTTVATSIVDMESYAESIPCHNPMDDIFAVRSYAPRRRSINFSERDALSKNGRVTVRLKQKSLLSGDCILLEFALPMPDQSLGLPIGQHVLLSTRSLEHGRSKRLARPYTQVSSDQDKGRVLFVVKVLRPTSSYPFGGRMSQYLDDLLVGDSIEIRGPIGEFEYLKLGMYVIHDRTFQAKQINLVAGGSGITPIMQLAAHIIRQPDDATQMSLLYACRCESDLLLRSVLDQWAELFPERFRVRYILSDAWPSGWKHSTGFVDALVLGEYLFSPSDDVLTLLCGPPIFVSRGCLPGLSVLGYQYERIYSF